MTAKKSTAEIEAVDRRHLSDSSFVDPDTLDPSMHYRFIQESPIRIARAKLKGYRVVRPSEDGVQTIHGQEDAAPEDIIKHGDRILMAVPKARHHEHKRVRQARTLQRLQANDQRVRELARERGVKIHDTDEDD